MHTFVNPIETEAEPSEPATISPDSHAIGRTSFGFRPSIRSFSGVRKSYLTIYFTPGAKKFVQAKTILRDRNYCVMEERNLVETNGEMKLPETISKLLAGASRAKPSPPVGYADEEYALDENEDSGIMEIQYTEDTTSPEDTSKKPSRSARKCKWCENFARGASNLCAKHGGGRRCHCGKLARGPSNLCMKHGGGRRCSIVNCGAAAVYKSDYCRSHGGGKRCIVEGCVASVYSSRETYCFKHGGGIRCAYEGGCPKAPVGKTEYCIRHGGGKRCSVDGCIKGAVCEGMCVKHHQDAYKIEAKAEETGSATMSPASPLRMVSTVAVTIKEEVSVSPSEVLPPTL